jgi:hypothetical protein
VSRQRNYPALPRITRAARIFIKDDGRHNLPLSVTKRPGVKQSKNKLCAAQSFICNHWEYTAQDRSCQR